MAESLENVKARLDGGKPYKAKLEEAVATGTLTSSAGGFLVNQSLALDDNAALPMSVGSGTKCVEFARYSDQDGCWLKTCQGYSQRKMFTENEEPSSEEWSETWPRSGIASGGIAYWLPPLVPRISGTGCSLLPTPTDVSKGGGSSRSGDRIDETPTLQGMARKGLLQMFPTPTEHGNYNRKGASPKSGDGLATAVGGALNADWVSILMGFPVDWTVVEDGSAESPE